MQAEYQFTKGYPLRLKQQTNSATEQSCAEGTMAHLMNEVHTSSTRYIKVQIEQTRAGDTERFLSGSMCVTTG